MGSSARLFCGASLMVCSTLVANGAYAQSSSTAPATPSQPAVADAASADAFSNSGDIVVTARRREESLQRVPVSVTAFNTEMIAEKQITELRDLTRSAPGLVFTQSGSGPNINVTLRGQTKSTVGAGLPSVITYLNEVPLPSYGSSLPTYDVSSLQVLKGPQGTYFGRNTTGGAVLVYSNPPTYDFGGYGSVTYGSYNWLETEGAINLPIIADKVALRVAFNTVDRDGYTKNLSIPGKDWDDRNDRSYRASLLLEPIDGLRNITVADYLKVDTVGLSSIVLNALNAGGARNAALAQFYNCSAAPAVTAACNPAAPTAQNDVDVALARQKSVGIRAGFTDQLPVTRYTVKGISNTTTLDLGAATIKNIFGFRSIVFDSESNTDGLDIPLINSHFREDSRQYSDELQVSGSLFGDRLSWLFGGFYLKGEPGGVSGRALEQFRTPATVVANLPFGQGYYRDTSKAVFGQLIYDLSDVVAGLKLNGGLRQTWDKQELCSITNPYGQPRIDEDGCQASATSFKNSVKFDALTWTVGADFQASRNIFFYITARKGYRGGGINAPRLGGTLAPYQFFRPEEINDIEVGTKLDWTAGTVSGRFNLALYRGKYKNIQGSVSAIPANFDGDGNNTNDPASSSLVVNRGAARIQGLEFDGYMRPVEGLTLSYGGSYTDPKFTNFTLPPLFSALSAGTPIFSATPEWTLTGGVRYEASLGPDIGNLIFNADIYHSTRIRFTEVVADSYQLVNARLDWADVLGTQLTASVFVRNLFNAEYIAGANLTSSGTTILTGPYGAPRMVAGQLRYRF